MAPPARKSNTAPSCNNHAESIQDQPLALSADIRNHRQWEIWVYLAVEMIASGIVEMMDKRPVPMIPRWLTWLTFAGAASLLTAMGPGFFKSGPFAYHGLLGFYLPMAVWGTYLLLTSWYMLKELDREACDTRQSS